MIVAACAGLTLPWLGLAVPADVLALTSAVSGLGAFGVATTFTIRRARRLGRVRL